jgi:hypothetical protein
MWFEYILFTFWAKCFSTMQVFIIQYVAKGLNKFPERFNGFYGILNYFE